MTDMFPFKVTVDGGRVPFIRAYQKELNAEIFIRVLENDELYKWTLSRNYEKSFTDEQIITEAERQDRLIKEANRLQDQAVDRTSRNRDNPNWDPCEVCGEKHRNYNCCDKCNLDNHRCHFCGDDLGHSEVSTCYILEGLDD